MSGRQRLIVLKPCVSEIRSIIKGREGSCCSGGGVNRIRIRNICIASIVVTLMLALLSIGLFLKGQAQFEALQTATDTYVACEKDAQQLQTASNYLTEQT